MIPYLLLLLLPIGWAAARAVSARAEKLAAAGIWLTLLLFIGLRHQTGGDWDNYLLLFQRSRVSSIPVALTQSDAGYMLVDIIVSRIGLGFGIANLICASVFVTGLVRYCARQPVPALALTVALPVLILLSAMGAMRQSVAVGLLMWAIVDAADGRRGRASIAVIGAVAFHWSAIALLPIPALLFMRRPARIWPLLAAGAMLSALVLTISALVPAIGAQLTYASDAAGGGVRVTMCLLAVIGLLWLWRKGPPATPEAWVIAYLGALALLSAGLLLLSATTADRFAYYAIPVQMYVVARLGDAVRGKVPRIAAHALLCMPYLGLMIIWLSLSSYRHCYIPYRSYLASPELLVSQTPPERYRVTCMRATYGP